MGISIAVLLFPCSSSPRECFERGDAIYRSGARGFGHSGLYVDWNPRREPRERISHRVVDAITEGVDSVVTRDFKAFCSGGNLWSVRRWRHRLSADRRRVITNTAISIAQKGAVYRFFFLYKNPLGYPRSFRCDGLVEYCYEVALGHPWFPGLNGGIVINDNWYLLSPVTQMIQLLSQNQARLDTLRIMAPYPDDTVSDTVWTLVYIHDSDYGSGVEKVQLWMDDDTSNTLEETVTEDIWNSAYFNWDSRAVKNGKHVLHARGFDQAGNDATDSVALFIDNSVPRVTRTYPDDSQPPVPPDTTIWIEFNKRMDSTSVENAILFAPHAVARMSWDDSTRLLLIEPELDLDCCSEYTLTISDSARDSQGRRLDGDGDGESGGKFRLTFLTGPPRMRIWAEPPVSHLNQGESTLHKILVRNLSKNAISGELCSN
ncbi:MAG: Ig-like domain-containing protein, partial [bacterium]